MIFVRTASSHPVVGADRCGHGAAPGSVTELARRKRTTALAGDLELPVIFHRNRFTVMENRCPHGGAPLENARVSRRTLTCAVHSYRYSLTDGACVSIPRYSGVRGGRLRTLPTREVDGCLYTIVDEPERTG